MADYTITSLEVTGGTAYPLIDINEYLNTTWISYTFPSSQGRVRTDTKFVVKFNRPVDLTALSNSNFKIELIRYGETTTGEEIVDAFEDIDTVEAYDSISRTLVLTLSNNLTADSRFLFTISNLTDTTGLTQVENHYILFETASVTETITVPDPVDYDTVIIEDYTLMSPPVPAGYSSALVVSNITDGTLNIATTTSTITLAFTDTVSVSQISLVEENLSTGIITTLTPTITQDSETFVVTIALDNIGTVDTPVYLNTNCIYTINAIYATFEFATTLTPFYITLGAFAPFTTAAQTDPIGWARTVYEFSCEVRARMGDSYLTYESDKADAIKQFTKYSILSFVEGSSTNDSFLLGELQVTSGSSKSGSSSDYKAMADIWETKLFGRSKIVQSADPFTPRYAHRRHETAKSAYYQDWKTFNRKLY